MSSILVVFNICFADFLQHFWIAVDLKGMWIETKVHPGESINLIGKVWKEGEWRRIVIDDSQGMIVTHPDFALSGKQFPHSFFLFYVKARNSAVQLDH